MVLGSDGGTLFPPLIRTSGYNTEKIRKIYERCISFLEEIKEELNLEDYRCACYTHECGVDAWVMKLFEHGWHCNKINMVCYMDTTLSEDVLLNSIRRTNRYSIKKAETLWNHRVINSRCSDEEIRNAVDTFHRFHTRIAGRETRSQETWDQTVCGIVDGGDFLIELYDKEKLIGMSFFRTTRYEATYSVAVYDRSYYNQPVGHLSQWLAIKHMKDMGIKTFFVGIRPYAADWNRPTEKEISIGLFKEGWATAVYPLLYIEDGNSKM